MKVRALLYLKTGEIIYSRARHDFRHTSDGKCAIDGGLDYVIYTGFPDDYKKIIIDIPVTSSELYNDWNEYRSKYGYINPGTKVEILDSYDFDSFEYRKETAIWGTYGPKGDQPKKLINLIKADTDHLEAILKNVSTLTPEYRKIIESILEDRKNGV